MDRIRITTYNVHRCRGLDGRTRPGRIVDVLREVKADIIALQEVVSREEEAANDKHQARYIADEMGLKFCLGENRKLRGAAYGNVVLSRFPMQAVKNYDLSVEGFERRGCLHIDVDIGGAVVHVFNVHLGTDYIERRHQGRRLTDMEPCRELHQSHSMSSALTTPSPMPEGREQGSAAALSATSPSPKKYGTETT